MTADTSLFMGIDVGTGSARVGIFTLSGDLLASDARPIHTSSPRAGFAQQSTADIWGAITAVCHSTLAKAAVPADRIGGIGVDATCSLAVVGVDDAPVSICPDGTPTEDVILWSDHRAIREAAAIDQIGNDALQTVGGTMSPEMQLPKLLWLQKHHPDRMKTAQHFFDLPDWIVYRATGDKTRSLCSATCKWTYRGDKGLSGEGWDQSFLTEIGLAILTENGCARIGQAFAAPGTPMWSGLTATAAAEMGLMAGTPVAASLIDAYAGALGTIRVAEGAGLPAATCMALIAGTSACHITISDAAAFVPGVWGPYQGVLFPGSWANEAGQSACGALIDRILNAHPAKADIAGQGSIYAMLEHELTTLAGSADKTHGLTRDLHLQPDFSGNRAPLADPNRRGAITGLTMEAGSADLALSYLATIQALAYGTRQIIETVRSHGVTVDAIVVSGGLARNGLYLREHADATGCPVLVPDHKEPVLLGSAMLGACAAGQFASLTDAAAAMSGKATQITPRCGPVTAYHDAKYAVFRKMQNDFMDYATLMTSPKGS